MGAGGVGSFFGARLANAGVPVTLVCRGAHAAAIARDGLAIEGAGGVERVAVAATEDPAALASCTVVLVCVKSVDTEAVAPTLAAHAPGTLLVSLQNGVDNAWRLRARVAQAVVPAVVYVSVEMTGPGRIRHNGGGRLVVGHALADSGAAAASQTLDALVAAFERAGVPCARSSDIRVDLWTKLAANCAYNALSALTQLRYGRIVADDGARDVMRMVTQEVAAVAAADGVPVSVDALSEAVRRIAEVMPEALSSTAQDVLARRPTEIDDLNGFVVRRGDALGVPAPVNRTLQALVALTSRSTRRT